VSKVVPENLLYTKEHEWVLLENTSAKVGITQYAQEQLGDVVYIELPNVGSSVKQMAPCGVIESVKAVSELFSPLSGKVAQVNSDLIDHPEKVNQDPYGEGWMFVLEGILEEEVKNLLRPKEYESLIVHS
jgi:glycine cleavage system H protein